MKNILARLFRRSKAAPQAEVSTPPEPRPATAVEPAERFDPKKHTVAEVKAYLAAHPEDKRRVMRAERAGKNRRTIVGS